MSREHDDDEDWRDLAPAPRTGLRDNAITLEEAVGEKRLTFEEVVDRFVTNDAKASVWDSFQTLLNACARIHARDCTDDCTDAAPPPSVETQRYIHGGALAHAYAGMPAGARDAGLVPAFPLERRRFASTQYVEALSDALGDGAASVDRELASMMLCSDGDAAAAAVRHDDNIVGVLGYASAELSALGDAEGRRQFSDLYPTPSKCIEHLCSLGRVWEGTILIPGMQTLEEQRASPYGFQVLWFDAVAGMFLISHTAQGDEQLCHLTLHDDGSSGSMKVSFYDNETYCTGTIDGETGVISGSVSQLMRAEEGFFEDADATRNTFILHPVDIHAPARDDQDHAHAEEVRNRVIRRQYLLAQWSRSPNFLAGVYGVLKFIRSHMRSHHMVKYMLRRLAHETPMLNVEAANVTKAPRITSISDMNAGASESLLMLWPRLPGFGEMEFFASLNEFHDASPMFAPPEDDWYDVWTIERMNTELLCCKFRNYTRIMRERVFTTSADKRKFLHALRNIRRECHRGMSQAHGHFSLLMWRLKSDNDVDTNRQLLEFNMLKSIRVQASRMTVAYESVDAALRECESRLPVDAEKSRCLTATGDEQYTCSICLLELERGAEAIKLDCMHTFHLSCCAQWLHSHSTCPNCRVVVREVDDSP